MAGQKGKYGVLFAALGFALVAHAVNFIIDVPPLSDKLRTLHKQQHEVLRTIDLKPSFPKNQLIISFKVANFSKDYDKMTNDEILKSKFEDVADAGLRTEITQILQNLANGSTNQPVWINKAGLLVVKGQHIKVLIQRELPNPPPPAQPQGFQNGFRPAVGQPAVNGDELGKLAETFRTRTASILHAQRLENFANFTSYTTKKAMPLYFGLKWDGEEFPEKLAEKEAQVVQEAAILFNGVLPLDTKFEYGAKGLTYKDSDGSVHSLSIVFRERIGAEDSEALSYDDEVILSLMVHRHLTEIFARLKKGAETRNLPLDKVKGPKVLARSVTATVAEEIYSVEGYATKKFPNEWKLITDFIRKSHPAFSAKWTEKLKEIKVVSRPPVDPNEDLTDMDITKAVFIERGQIVVVENRLRQLKPIARAHGLLQGALQVYPQVTPPGAWSFVQKVWRQLVGDQPRPEKIEFARMDEWVKELAETQRTRDLSQALDQKRAEYIRFKAILEFLDEPARKTQEELHAQAIADLERRKRESQLADWEGILGKPEPEAPAEPAAENGTPELKPLPSAAPEPPPADGKSAGPTPSTKTVPQKKASAPPPVKQGADQNEPNAPDGLEPPN